MVRTRYAREGIFDGHRAGVRLDHRAAGKGAERVFKERQGLWCDVALFDDVAGAVEAQDIVAPELDSSAVLGRIGKK